MRVNVYLKRNGEIVCYGELGKTVKSKERKHLTLEQKTEIVVRELNELLPSVCVKQQTMYYFVRKEA